MKTKMLGEIIDENKIYEFALISDIEGAEYHLIQNEPDVFANFKMIIMEAHKTAFNEKTIYPNEIRNMLLEKGFSLIEEHGPNFVLAK